MFVRAHRSLRLNAGLVVGDDACLVVDTRSTQAEALDLIAAVRTVTRLPWVVVNTHAHFDHCFGNAAFRPAEIWGHPGCAEALRGEAGEAQRAGAAAWYRATGLVELADGIEEAVIDPPDRLTAGGTSLPLGGRTAELAFLGRGHTDHDLVVVVPDAGVVFAGDLVEEGDPPDFGDSFPLDWGPTLLRLAPRCAGAVVPGHGAVVDEAFVRSAAGDLAGAAAVAAEAFATGGGVEQTWSQLPYPEATSRVLVRRAWEQLAISGRDWSR